MKKQKKPTNTKSITIDAKAHQALLTLQYKMTRDDYRPQIGELAEKAIYELEKAQNAILAKLGKTNDNQ